MKKNTSETLIENINSWRALTESNSEAPLYEADKNSIDKLKGIRKSCSHDVYVHLSTDYKDDGLGDPDFYSSYKCLKCGSMSYDVPSNRDNPDTLCINISCYAPNRKYTDEEKFAIVEFRFRQLARDHPEYNIETIVKILNEEFAKK